MSVTFVLGLFLFLSVTVVQGGEWCYTYDDDIVSGIGDTKWCYHGCCGDFSYRECCWYSVPIGLGCLAGVATIVTFILVIVRCLRKQRAQQGQGIGSRNTTTTVVTGDSVPMNVYSTPPSRIQYAQPMGNTNAAYSQMQTQAPPPMKQKWQQPPPSYGHVNRNYL